MIEGPRWYIVRTLRKREKAARASIRSEGFEVYLPLLLKTNRKGESYGEPFFPSFLFVRLAFGEGHSAAIYSTHGVAGVLGAGGRPSPLPDKAIALIREREHEGYVRLGVAPASCRFAAGQTVRITKGPWASLEAVFVEPIDSRRCLVLLKFLGDSQRLAKAELAHIA
jgi:transcriptional antiterminator RfaH